MYCWYVVVVCVFGYDLLYGVFFLCCVVVWVGGKYWQFYICVCGVCGVYFYGV